MLTKATLTNFWHKKITTSLKLIFYLCRMMHKYILLLGCLSLTLVCWSQQRSQYSLFMLNKYGENAAYGGMERSLNIVTSYRDQYSTLIGNPRSFYINCDIPFYLLNGGVGFSFQNSKSGIIDLSHAKASYNRVWGTSIGFLSVGIRVGTEFLTLSGEKIITPEGTYESSINHNDPYLDAIATSGVGLSWEVASYFYNNNYEIGINLYNIPKHSFSAGNGSFELQPGFSIIGQYKTILTESIVIKPSIMIKVSPAVMQTDIAALVEWNKQTFAGLGLRGYSNTSLDAIQIFFGSNINDRCKLAYGYDFGISALKSAHQGSHEFTVIYNLQKLIGLGLPPKITYNPRHL
jgi:type IX secretion system PorP/SprF family membrane protein